MTHNDQALVYLVCGSTGAGKTTYSRKLAQELDGIHFSIDEWMVTLFGEDAPKELNPGWIFPRTNRCETQIWAIAMQLASTGTPAILDLGFQKKAHRQKFMMLAREAGISTQLHFLDVAASERWNRVQKRNAEQGETYQMEITRGMFDYVETIWEPPGADEIAIVSQAG